MAGVAGGGLSNFLLLSVITVRHSKSKHNCSIEKHPSDLVHCIVLGARSTENATLRKLSLS